MKIIYIEISPKQKDSYEFAVAVHCISFFYDQMPLRKIATAGKKLQVKSFPAKAVDKNRTLQIINKFT